MAETKTRRISRKELLELLIEQTKENESLRAALSDAEKRLESRELHVANAGTLAEAALSVSQVLEKADEAAGIYLENAKRLEREAQEKYDAMLAAGRAEVEAMLTESRAEAEAILARARAEAERTPANNNSRSSEKTVSSGFKQPKSHHPKNGNK